MTDPEAAWAAFEAAVANAVSDPELVYSIKLAALAYGRATALEALENIRVELLAATDDALASAETQGSA